MIKRVLTIADVCARLARSRTAVLELRREDATFPRPFQLRPGGDDVFDLADLDAWIDARKAASREETSPGALKSSDPAVNEAVARAMQRAQGAA